MLHVAATEGPLNRCFRWGEIIERLIDQPQIQGRPRVPPRKDVVIKPVTAKLPDKKKYYNMGVVSAYADSFVDMAASTSGKAYLETDKCGAILPLWVAAIPTDAQMPEQKDMASAAAFMALCRSQRQTDEKGLSAWSCGYGATGNPTKPQLRMQKKLSMVLGILQSMDTKQTLVIFDDLPQELPILHAQLMLWVTRNSVLQDKRWKYFVSSSASKIISALPDHCVTQTNFIGRYQLLYFPNTFVELPRYSEWSKVDVSQISSLQSLVHPYFPMKRSDISDGEAFQTATSTQTVTVPELSKVMHVHVYTRLFSKRVFDFFNVYTIGSVHNMMGLLSTDPHFMFAQNEGQEPWVITSAQGVPLKMEEFVVRTMKHNAARCAYFLNGQYFFNPKLNLLRHVQGKTLDFVMGALDDVKGIAVKSVQYPEWIGDAEGDEYERLEDGHENYDQDYGQPVDDGPEMAPQQGSSSSSVVLQDTGPLQPDDSSSSSASSSRPVVRNPSSTVTVTMRQGNAGF